MEKYDIIERPLVTEEAVGSAEKDNIYIFRVNPRANRVEIRKAIEEIYDVRVLSVKTANVRGKPRTYRRFYQSRTANWKNAYLKLRDTDYIDLI